MIADMAISDHNQSDSRTDEPALSPTESVGNLTGSHTRFLCESPAASQPLRLSGCWL